MTSRVKVSKVVDPQELEPLELTKEEMLSNQKQCALRHLAEGKSIAATARLVEAHRMTIHRWLKDDPAFQAAFNAWQAELRISTRARLAALCDSAVDTVQGAIENPDGKLAMKLLEGMGMISKRAPGPQEAADVEAQRSLKKRRKEVQLKSALSNLDMDDSIADIGRSIGRPPKDIRKMSPKELIKVLEEKE